jgi:hypothetical protein
MSSCVAGTDARQAGTSLNTEDGFTDVMQRFRTTIAGGFDDRTQR